MTTLIEKLATWREELLSDNISCERERNLLLMSVNHHETQIALNSRNINDIDRAIAALTPAPAPVEIEIPEGFTKWEGGVCPVDPDATVEIMHPNGERHFGSPENVWWQWHNSSTSDGIIAYRVLQPLPTDEQDDASEFAESDETSGLCVGCLVREGELHEADCPVLADIRANDIPAEHISILTGDPAIEPESGLHGEPVATLGPPNAFLNSIMERGGTWHDGGDNPAPDWFCDIYVPSGASSLGATHELEGQPSNAYVWKGWEVAYVKTQPMYAPQPVQTEQDRAYEEDDKQAAFEQGRAAYLRGNVEGECPYAPREHRLYTPWMNGWIDAHPKPEITDADRAWAMNAAQTIAADRPALDAREAYLNPPITTRENAHLADDDGSEDFLVAIPTANNLAPVQTEPDGYAPVTRATDPDADFWARSLVNEQKPERKYNPFNIFGGKKLEDA